MGKQKKKKKKITFCSMVKNQDTVSTALEQIMTQFNFWGQDEP